MVDEQPVASTTAPTQVSEVPITPTAKSFTEDDINRIVKERLDRERKKYADYEDLKLAKSKLDEIEMANKSKEEQALAKLLALEAKIAESEKMVRAAEIKERKRAALENAKLGIPKDVALSEMLDMIPGETEEAIESAIMRLKKLFPENKAQGIGTQTTVEAKAPKTVESRMAEIQIQLKDRALDYRTKENLAREMLSLSNRQMREQNSI